MMKPYCIIPARANSKGLKNKNVLFFDDKPLILHTVDQAIESGLFDIEDIIVSTDSSEYMKVCDTRGVTTLKRPDYLATDKSTSYDVLRHLFESLDKSRPFVLLQVTSPLRTANHIREAYGLFEKSEYKTVVSMKDVGVDLRITTRLDENNKVVDGKMLDKNIRRQDGDIYYRPNGAIYIAIISEYLKTGSFMTTDTTAYVMKQNESLDIDDYDDFVLASLYKKNSNNTDNNIFNQNRFVKNIIDCASKNIAISDYRFKKLVLEDYELISEKHCKINNIFQNIDLLGKFENVLIFLNIDEYKNFQKFKSYFTKLLKHCERHHQKIKIVLPIFASYSINYNNEELNVFNQKVNQLCDQYDVISIDLNGKITENLNLDFRYSSDGVNLNKKGLNKVQSIINKKAGVLYEK